MRNLTWLCCFCLLFFVFSCGEDGGSGSERPENAIRITNELPPAECNTEYEAYINATGGTGSYIYEIVDGELPAGLSMTGDGFISGDVPCDVGAHAFTVKLTDATYEEMYEEFSLMLLINYIGVDIYVYPYLPFGQLGEDYETEIYASGGHGGYKFSIIEGDLPAGLTLSEAGSLSGTVEEDANLGAYIVDIRVEDSVYSGNYSEGPVLVTVLRYMPDGTEPITNTGLPVPAGSEPEVTPLTFSSPTKSLTLHDGNDVDKIPMTIIEETGVKITVDASDDVDVQFNVFDADGHLVDSNLYSDYSSSLYIGSIGPGTYTIEIFSPDKEPCEYELSIGDVDPLMITTDESLPMAVAGNEYTARVQASGGYEGEYVFSSPDIPDGLMLSESGNISGTVRTASNYDFTVEVASREFASAKRLMLTVNQELQITTNALAAATNNYAYQTTLASAGGYGGYTYSTVSSLPTGMKLNSNGTISGTPNAAAGDYRLFIFVTDSEGLTNMRDLVLTVKDDIQYRVSNPPDYYFKINNNIIPISGYAFAFKLSYTHTVVWNGRVVATWTSPEVMMGETPTRLTYLDSNGWRYSLSGEASTVQSSLSITHYYAVKRTKL